VRRLYVEHAPQRAVPPVAGRNTLRKTSNG